MADIVDAYPLTRMQGGMVFHSEMAAGDALYQNVDSLRVHVRFHTELFATALAGLLDRHPVLRTSFDLTGYGEAVQLVHRRVDLPLEIHHGAPADYDAWMTAEANRGFDWSKPPLIRFAVHVLGEREFRLSISSHHAVLDGWSVNALLAELLDHYRRLLTEPAAAAPPAPVTGPADLVAVEQKVLASDAEAQWWRQTMAGATVTRLPRLDGRARRSRERVPSREAPLPAGLSSGLRTLAAAQGVPVKSVLLAAHLVVLSRLGATTDVSTGLVSNGRPETPDAHRALGLFLNTLPLRCRLDGGSWRDLVNRVYAIESELLAHRHYPLLDLQRACGGAELFETSFNFVNFHALDHLADDPEFVIDGWQHFQQTSIPFAVTFGLGGVALGGRPDEIRMLIAHDSDEFDAAQIDDIQARYLATLARMAADPDTDHRDHDLLGDAERERIVTEVNNTAAHHPVELAHRLFEARVDAAPDAVAVRHNGSTTTYRELDRRANRIARRLREAGIGVEDRVAVAVERSTEMIAAVLGVLKAGAAYVPLDVTNPPGRLAGLLADSDARAMVADAIGAGRVPAGDRPVVRVDADKDRLGPADDVRPPVAVSPRNAAYVLYTSGSTGRPKGVLVEHRSITNFTASVRELFALDDRDRVLQYASLSFDVSVFEIFGALHCGACVVLIERETALSVDDLAEVMRRERVSVMDMPPAVMALLSATSFPDLRAVFVGGEEFSADLVNRWALPGRMFVNGYGPTEATVTVTVKHCEGYHERRPSIGNPMPNHRAYVLDPSLHAASTGVPGELCISGAGVARGYLGRPGLTAERFVPDPYAIRPGERMYRTGDLAVRRRDGEIGFLGRIDDQVKIRGLRIEPGEICAVLDAHPAVHQSIVVVRPGPGGGHRLVAYLAGSGMDVTEVREYAADRLPRHMVPERFVELDRLPVTGNGKVDRDALPDPGTERPLAGRVPIAPRDDLELVLRELWSEVLEVDTLGVEDDFFAVGGNSLLATQLLAKVREMFGIPIQMRALFEKPTIAAAAALLRQDPARRDGLEAMAAILADLCRSDDPVGAPVGRGTLS